MQRRHNCSPAASFANCAITLYLLKVHLQTFLSIPITQKKPNFELWHSCRKWAIWSKVYSGLHVKYPLFLSQCSETWLLSTAFRKVIHCQISSITSNGSRGFPCGRADRRTDIKSLIVILRKSLKTPHIPEKLTGTQEWFCYLKLVIYISFFS